MADTTEEPKGDKSELTTGRKVSKIPWSMRIAASVHECSPADLAEKIKAAGITVKSVGPTHVYFEYKVPYTVNNHYEAAEFINKQYAKKWPKSKALVPL